MGVADDTVLAEVSPALWPGETIVFSGFVLRPSNPDVVYLVASSTRRTFFVEGRFGLTSLVVLPGGERFALEHRTLEVVAEESLFLGSLLRFQVHGQEPRGFQLAPQKVGTGCDGLAAFVATFLPWLRRHVQQGSFRTAEGHALAEAELTRAAAESAALRQRSAAEAARREAMRPVRWPLVPGFVFLLAGLFGVFTLVRFAGQLEESERWVARLDKDLAEAKDTAPKKRTEAQKDLVENADERLASAKSGLATAETNRVAGFAFTGGLILGVACFVLAGRLTKKKRAAAAPA